MAAPQPQKRKVSDITSTLLRPALTSHFLVHFALPDFVSKPNAVAQDRIYLECSEASLPGSSLTTFDINNDFHGVTERRAYRRMFDDRIDLTFYVEAENYLTIRLFEDWIGGIMNGNGDEDLLKNSNHYYTAKYPTEYRRSLSIVKFERDYSSQLIYNFVDAYPINIGSMPVSYEGSSLLKCTVGFTYLRYYIEKPKAEEPQEQPTVNPEVNSLLDNLPPPPPPPLPPLPPPPPPPKPFDIRDRDIRARANFDGRFDPI